MAEVVYGGQAVIEGVMIRSPRFVSVACRLPQADGSHGIATPIDVHTEAVASAFARYPWLRRIPLVRGIFALVEMLSIGLRSLERSGNLQVVTALVCPWLLLTTDPGPSPGDSTGGAETGGQLNGPILWGTIAVSFLFGLALFVLLPTALAQWVGRWLGWETDLARNLLEGLFRLVIFVGYILLIGQMRDVRRVFMYHGAEHKVVNGWEAQRNLTVENVQDMSVIHPRCGTNFAFIVIVLSVVVFSFLPWYHSHLARMGLRLLCLPVVAGLGFELIKLVGTYRSCRPLQWLILPGLALQYITTRPPDDDMIEVALASFNAVRTAEEGGPLTCARQAAPAAEVTF